MDIASGLGTVSTAGAIRLSRPGRYPAQAASPSSSHYAVSAYVRLHTSVPSMIKARLNVNSTTVRIHIYMHVHMHMPLGRHVGLTNHQVGYSARTGDYMWTLGFDALLLTRHVCLFVCLPA